MEYFSVLRYNNRNTLFVYLNQRSAGTPQGRKMCRPARELPVYYSQRSSRRIPVFIGKPKIDRLKRRNFRLVPAIEPWTFRTARKRESRDQQKWDVSNRGRFRCTAGRAEIARLLFVFPGKIYLVKEQV